MKLAVTREGWDERSDGDFVPRNKGVHAGVASLEEFARTRICDTARRRDTGTAGLVAGGDGAPVAKKAADLAPRSLFQLDRFHLKRAVMRAFSGDRVPVPGVCELATAGRLDEVLEIIDEHAGDARPGRRKELENLK